MWVGDFREEFQKVSWNQALKGKKRARGRPRRSTKRGEMESRNRQGQEEPEGCSRGDICLRPSVVFILAS